MGTYAGSKTRPREVTAHQACWTNHGRSIRPLKTSFAVPVIIVPVSDVHRRLRTPPGWCALTVFCMRLAAIAAAAKARAPPNREEVKRVIRVEEMCSNGNCGWCGETFVEFLKLILLSKVVLSSA